MRNAPRPTVLAGCSVRVKRVPEAPETLPRHVLERRLRSSRGLNVLLGAIAAAALVFGGVQWSQANGASGGSRAAASDAEADRGGSGGSDEAGSGGAGSGASLERRAQDDAMAIGDIDAPVVLSEWVDFRCPFCAVFSRDTLPVIVQEYVDAGKVRIEMHDVAFFGEESTRAAAAARAAGEQGKYFEFLEAVYAAAPESGHPDLPPKELIAHAKTAGVPDLQRFEQDMGREDLVAAVEESTVQAQRIGVTGVPFFVVDGTGLSGAQPADAFRQVLDRAVADAK